MNLLHTHTIFIAIIMVREDNSPHTSGRFPPTSHTSERPVIKPITGGEMLGDTELNYNFYF